MDGPDDKQQKATDVKNLTSWNIANNPPPVYQDGDLQDFQKIHLDFDLFSKQFKWPIFLKITSSLFRTV